MPDPLSLATRGMFTNEVTGGDVTLVVGGDLVLEDAVKDLLIESVPTPDLALESSADLVIEPIDEDLVIDNEEDEVVI